MSQSAFSETNLPMLAQEARIEGVGVRALDRRRVDVAVDLAPSAVALTMDLVIVGPSDDELCSTLIVDSREQYIDRIIHLRHDAQPGTHTLHVGLFRENLLVDRTSRSFEFPADGDA